MSDNPWQMPYWDHPPLRESLWECSFCYAENDMNASICYQCDRER